MPITRLIRHIILFLLPLTVLLSIAEYSIRKVPVTYQVKYNGMQQCAGEMRALVLGSSHSYFGICPDSLSVRAYSLANVSQDLTYDYMLLNSFIDKCNSLEYVILPISYFSMYERLESGVGNIRATWYRLYMHVGKYTPENMLEIANWQVAKKKWIYYYVHHNNMADCSVSGFGLAYKLSDRAKNWDNGEEHVKMNTLSDSEYEYNKNVLNKIALLCKSRNIKLIMVSTPTWHTYYDKLNAKQLADMYSAVNEVCGKYGNVFYYDYMRDKRFTDNDFFDADHLSDVGAMKFTALIDSIIAKQ